MKRYAVIVAGGSGSRMGSATSKQFLLLGNQPILMHTLSKFDKVSNVHIILVLPKNEIEIWKQLCSKHNFNVSHQLVEGGITRFDSVKNGLHLVGKDSLVAIHDGVRPLISTSIIEESFQVTEEKGSAVTTVPLKDSIRKKEGATTVSKNRNEFFLVQTPQTFKSSVIKQAYSNSEDGEKYTDDASVFESQGGSINLIEGSYRNIKITTPEDLLIAQELLKLM